jgi:serine/threonine-protein kinase
MLTESAKRAALLAVSRYGADRARVQGVVQAVLDAQAQGKSADLFSLLVSERLLTAGQAGELRLGLEATQIDPLSPKNAVGDSDGNGHPHGNENGQGQVCDDDKQELRALGDFRILRRLGKGGMGDVYLGYEESANRQVAIKVLPSHMAMTQALVDRFYREAKSGALLNHPNIVRNITVGQDQVTGKHYLVLEYVPGTSAQSLLERFGKLEVADAIHIILDIARALEHAHSRNIVHRDIKPANILVSETGLAKLADLGLAKRTDEPSHLTAARQGFGTPYYMPYEQAMNARNADARSDIYALGATLYHLITGEVPFPGLNHLEIADKKKEGRYPPPSSLNPAVPSLLEQIMEKMLAFDPRDRYQTASELIVDLERSNLGAPVPSFIDLDLAMQDPLVRQRLTSPAQPTRPDLFVPADPPETLGSEVVWYIRYQDRKGRACKAKATLGQIVRRISEGKLQAAAEASLKPEGEFLPLSTYAAFQDALQARERTADSSGAVRPVSVPEPTAPDPTSSRAAGVPWWLYAGLGAALAIIATVAVVLVNVLGG